MEKIIINYCSGGLGNRLKPFSSCYAISKLTNRELGMLWYPTMRCRSRFESLFSNKFPELIVQDIHDSNSVTIYSHQAWVDHDYSLNSNPVLKSLASKYGVHPVDNSANIIKDNNKYIIVYSNDYLNGYELSACKQFFKFLTPNQDLSEKIKNRKEELQLDDSVIGVHARGTDFEPGGVTVNTYLSKMQIEYNLNKNVRFFVCSDSKDYENSIKNAFPNNTLFNEKQNWVHKHSSGGWVNNVETPEESVRDSLIDMYLLSFTNFKIYHKDSTFAHVVKMLQ
jgi:hypothetical protein